MNLTRSTMTPEELAEWEKAARWGRLFTSFSAPKGEVPHGTNSGYQYWACRCDACKAARSVYQRDWYERNRKQIAARRKLIRERDKAWRL